MENAAQLSRVRPHDFERIVPRVALMNDDVQPELHGEIELLLEQTGLFRFVGAIVDFRFHLLVGRGLKRLDENLRCLAFLRQLNAGKRVIIEAGLADRHDARAFRQLAQRCNHVLAGLPRHTWDERR